MPSNVSAESFASLPFTSVLHQHSNIHYQYMYRHRMTENKCFFAGGYAHIAPPGTFPERSEKTDTPVLPTTGMADAIAMTISKRTQLT